MFKDFRLIAGRPVYIQVKDYMKQLIIKGALQGGQKLPSTRELSTLLKVSRNSVISAYEALADDGFTYAVQGQGSYVSQGTAPDGGSPGASAWTVDWKARLSSRARLAEELDIMKRGIRAAKGTISFTSIAPDESLFDLENVKRAFLARMAVEGNVLLNYGYAKGYKPLIDYLRQYMEHKGVDTQGRDILITNGFTEGFDVVLSALGRKAGAVLCENPTHHTAIKNMKLHGFEVAGVPMERDGIHLGELKRALEAREYDCAYFIPSYHNPTGIVMSPEKRQRLMKLMAEYKVPVIEDGFNEELRYSGSHVAPLTAAARGGNSVIYLGSFSKVLFPGLRVGWVLADQELIYYLESVKRARSIHTSTLDQSILYQYLLGGNLEKYLKRARAEYKRKYELTLACCKEHIPYAALTGDGGLHLFITFEEGFSTRELLAACREQGVIFTAGDIFYTNGQGHNTLRLGFSRVADGDIRKGIEIIGRTARQLQG
ncbi:PLP-dependent aminotransferase family protein [Paenibacillus sp. S150]|uniref:MocR-like pyridoxine biosynthesis transcription factor PdxR n=1 Tax=Paenibacillus sp. S150 TaxID=2749826 RepID=UPI001C59279E|nr:PLP-dependent aminotransferase family protein [Paenibacillus sp. S150]MBW4083481.1 PLP-dependent aminotransferase family protein [Paenibacillus sp. S150]